MLSNKREIVERIQSLAKAKGISMKFLCDSIGKYRSYLACVRDGKVGISDNDVLTISNILGTTFAYLTGDSDNPELLTLPEDLPDKNSLRLIGRDGSKIERQLTDEQMEMLRALISQLPEAPDDL